jgi:hypothetical protein
MARNAGLRSSPSPIGWRKRLISGTCDRFGKFSTFQPRFKVNNMLVDLYVVTYAVPDSPSKKMLRVVGGDLKSVIETVEKTIPSATVAGAPCPSGERV